MGEETSSSTKFGCLWKRLCGLEQWLELGVRPEDCDPSDLDLLERDLDDCSELSRRIDRVRELLNENLPAVESPHEQHELVVRQSNIPDAGLGLFYEPSSSSPTNHNQPLAEGSTVCFYRGHIHNFHSIKRLKEKNYLMLVEGNLMVDPRPMPEVKARYINDPLNDEFVNCKFVPQKFWAIVVATRDINPGEELYVSYGDAFWSQQKTQARIKTK